MTVGIVRTQWSGTTGGPGLTQFAVIGAAGGDWNPSGTQSAVNAVRTFWDALKGYLPDEVRLLVLPSIDVYDRVTGDLVDTYTAGTAPATVAGSSAGTYAGGAGMKITWNTGQIRNGRRVRGSTFIVPAASIVYTANGTIGGTIMTNVGTAASNLISQLNAGGTPLAIYSRPVNGDNARAGFATEVIAGACGSKTAVLRGRRD
jgi:hypothetical protein